MCKDIIAVRRDFFAGIAHRSRIFFVVDTIAPKKTRVTGGFFFQGTSSVLFYYILCYSSIFIMKAVRQLKKAQVLVSNPI